MRTFFIAIALTCFVFAALETTEGHADSDFKVTLLGTSAPTPRPDRFGPSTLVEAGDQKLLFDAGRGVPIRLGQIHVPLSKVNVLFLTHYHSDHTSGIPDLWLTRPEILPLTLSISSTRRSMRLSLIPR